jgi:UDP-N-acetyl-D-mannosaminuronic acid dehydrogenase
VYPHFLFNGEPDLQIPPLARRINESMARFAVDTIEDRVGSLDGQPVLVLGVAYRGDVNEDAFSSAFRLRDELRAAGATIYAHDPFLAPEHLRAEGFEPYELGSDVPVKVAILQAAHEAYRALDPADLPGLELFVDGRNALDRAPFDQAGVRYVGIGR